MTQILISHQINHIFQGENGLCWAAAMAMILGGSDLDAVFGVARRAGINRENMAIQNSEISNAFRANNVANVRVPTVLNVAAIAEIVSSRPAVFFLRLRRGRHASNGGNKHVIVIRGVSGDGSRNTNILVNDPWTDEGASFSFNFLATQYWQGVDFIGRRR